MCLTDEPTGGGEGCRGRGGSWMSGRRIGADPEES